MGKFLYLGLVGLALTALFMNLYFGRRVFKLIGELRAKRIPMSFKHAFNKELREKELFPQFDKHRKLIETFSSTILASVKVAIAIFIGILLIGSIFIFY